MNIHPFIRILCSTACILFSYGAPAQSGAVMVREWGQYGNQPGQFKFPTMMAVSQSAQLYVVDQHNHRIQKFDSSGNFLLMWGKYGNGPGEFNYPYGIALDSKGDVYVTDMNNNRVQKFSPAGEFLGSAGSYGSGDAQFRYPYGIAIDKNDLLYIIDAFNYRIQKLDSSLNFISSWGSQESIGIKLYMPHEIAISREGNVLLSDRQNHRISVFTQDGKLLKRLGEYGEGGDRNGLQFSEPRGLAVAGDGTLYVADRYNFSVHRLNDQGQPVAEWLTTGIPADSKYFPMGLAVTKDGYVFVSDHYAHRILKYRTL